MWWFLQQDASKGAWDVDIKHSKEYRSRKAGLRMICRGFISLIGFIGLAILFPLIVNYIENPFVSKVLFVLSFGIYILLLSIIQIPIGLYYFIRYYKFKE